MTWRKWQYSLARRTLSDGAVCLVAQSTFQRLNIEGIFTSGGGVAAPQRWGCCILVDGRMYRGGLLEYSQQALVRVTAAFPSKEACTGQL